MLLLWAAGPRRRPKGFSGNRLGNGCPYRQSRRRLRPSKALGLRSRARIRLPPVTLTFESALEGYSLESAYDVSSDGGGCCSDGAVGSSPAERRSKG
jgi:hypothetical protein